MDGQEQGGSGMSHKLLVNVSELTNGLISLEFVEWDEKNKKDIVTHFHLPPSQARRVAFQMLTKVAEGEE